jgi:prepilin peptidase CpaA
MERVVFLVAAVVITALAASWDWRKGVIPSWITLGALGLALCSHAVAGAIGGGASGAGYGAVRSLLGALACGLLPALLVKMGGMGGGDLKLLVAVGAICGPTVGLEAQLFGLLVAALYAHVRLAREGRLARTIGNAASMVLGPVLPNKRRRTVSVQMMASLRFAPSAFVGTCLAVLVDWRTP